MAPYIGDILENCETVRELLDLPDFAVPVAMVVYGYPVKSQKDRKKPSRFDQEYIVFENQYHHLTPGEQLEMYRRRNEKAGKKEVDIYADIKAFCQRKYISLEMSRSVREYLKKFSGSSET